MGVYNCADCDRRLDSGDICGSNCTNCDSEDFLCDRCASDRTKEPRCERCDTGCSRCPMVGPDDKFGDYTRNDVEFGGCDAADCPLEGAFRSESCCEGCFQELAKECGVKADGKHREWTIEKCGHKVCEAVQRYEGDDSDYPPLADDQCWKCVGSERREKHDADKKSRKEAEEAKEAADAPSIISLLATLTSESAKAALSKWAEDHPAACEAAKGSNSAGASTSTSHKGGSREKKRKASDTDLTNTGDDDDSVIDLT
mmetsp:Transcript_25170/g.51391  ORF Transcript_25170/g.51391 Transcript_25170/m.51391 type:complete len:257 (-) Transcript_25170:151-921(-)